MVTTKSKATPDGMQGQGGLDYVRSILECIDANNILEVLENYRFNKRLGYRIGRKGYPAASMWRAYIAGYILNVPTTNSLWRRLKENPELRLICGLNKLPHRTTFLRFFSRLADHRDEVEAAFAAITKQIAALLPDFGKKIAIDSTVVPTHGNPNRKGKRGRRRSLEELAEVDPKDTSDEEASWTGEVKDKDASWTKKNSAKAHDKDGKIWFYGFKLHMAVDATHGIPMAGYVTTARQNDSPTLRPLMDLMFDTYEDFQPEYVIADRGYDSIANHRAVLKRGARPIIHIIDRKKHETELRNKIFNDIYTIKGVPTCLGMQEMEFLKTDPEKGHLYRCPAEGCALKASKGVVHCKDTFWVGPEEQQKNPRIAGPVRRGSAEWEENYALRQSIERSFKSMKESRRLDSHAFMGLKKVSLHAALSMLAYQATVLRNILAGDLKHMRWMVQKVA